MHKARVRANNYLWNKLDKLVPPQEDDYRLKKLRSRKGLQSLIVVLNSAAPSFCYYNDKPVTLCGTNDCKAKDISDTMSLELLKNIADCALENNLTLNLITDKNGLTPQQKEILKWNTYIVVAPYSVKGDSADIHVFDFESDTWNKGRHIKSVILRIASWNLPMLVHWLKENSLDFDRIALFIKDIDAVEDRQASVV